MRNNRDVSGAVVCALRLVQAWPTTHIALPLLVSLTLDPRSDQAELLHHARAQQPSHDTGWRGTIYVQRFPQGHRTRIASTFSRHHFHVSRVATVTWGVHHNPRCTFRHNRISKRCIFILLFKAVGWWFQKGLSPRTLLGNQFEIKLSRDVCIYALYIW